MALKHREALVRARTAKDGLAESGPALPGNLSCHDGLGSGELHPEPMGLAGNGHRSYRPAAPFPDGTYGALAAGTKHMAPPAATGDPGSIPVKAEENYLEAR